ncbi:MAG: hypothetical protein EA391_11205 [Balneolaceae bacterium]|nr:MAG: hypothetical protein EA391_11205 [Balneolaceae bacterium]
MFKHGHQKKEFMNHQDSTFQAPVISSLLAAILINIFMIAGCSTETDHDLITGTYQVEGLQIESTEPWPNTTNSEPVIDSAMVSLSIQVLKPENRQDTLQIVGLITTPPDLNGVFAHWENDSINIDVLFTGHSYKTTGTLKDGMIELKQVHNFRGRKITSYLEGSRVN